MLFRLLTLFLFSLLSLPAAAQDGPAALASRDHPLPLATDFNLITAVDVSDSITPDDEHLQYSGLARGVLDPQFLARIAEGAEQRIGFVAFTWSSGGQVGVIVPRSEEHTSELQSLMRISYAVFCLKKTT